MKIQNYFTTKSGKQAKLYSLVNGSGFQVDVTDMGGALVSIFVPVNGKKVDVLFGYDDPADYEENRSFYGALIGRVANRIAFGKFTLDGKNYQLPVNDNHNRPNSLHGGLCYGRRLWKAEALDDCTLRLSLLSPDGDAGYPGNLKVNVIYHLTEENALEISYSAVTDKTTVVNLTNHAYFNLNGEETGVCSGHRITSKAYAHTEVNDILVPTGKLLPCAGTSYDLSGGRTFEEINADKNLPMDFDDNFIIADHAGEFRKEVFKVHSSVTGITLSLDTDQPGVQFYMAPQKDDDDLCRHKCASAFCLEAQLWPDAPNHPAFPCAVLHPGEEYRQKTVYRFNTGK